MESLQIIFYTSGLIKQIKAMKISGRIFDRYTGGLIT